MVTLHFQRNKELFSLDNVVTNIVNYFAPDVARGASFHRRGIFVVMKTLRYLPFLVIHSLWEHPEVNRIKSVRPYICSLSQTAY